MIKYVEEQAHRQFVKGKQLLDSGRYEEAIQIFTELIQISESSLEDKAAKITYETSLNNRGVAKCEIGWDRRNRELFIEGLKDYEESVRTSGEEAGTPTLVAKGNLDYGRKQLEIFDQPRSKGFKAV